MTSVLFGGGLNYQRNNPVGTEIRGLRADVEDIRRLIDDITYRLDQAGVAKPVVEVAPASVPAATSAPSGNNSGPGNGAGRRR
jgi:hypothetical protein